MLLLAGRGAACKIHWKPRPGRGCCGLLPPLLPLLLQSFQSFSLLLPFCSPCPLEIVKTGPASGKYHQRKRAQWRLPFFSLEVSLPTRDKLLRRGESLVAVSLPLFGPLQLVRKGGMWRRLSAISTPMLVPEGSLNLFHFVLLRRIRRGLNEANVVYNSGFCK